MAVHFLGQDDEPLARLFGAVSGDTTDEFGRCKGEPGDGGVPVLTDCPHRFTAERPTPAEERSAGG